MSTKQLEDILKAKTPEELFGSMQNKTKAGIAFRRLAHYSHPDMFYAPDEKKLAGDAFAHLMDLWNKVEAPTTAKKNILKTRRHEYDLHINNYTYDVFENFYATYDAGHKQADILVTKSAADDDLAMNYVETLKKIDAKVDPNYRNFYPTLLETFRYNENGANHIVLALEHIDGFYSLKQVAERYPEGLDGKDFAWMFRRMLVAIGNLNDADILHGAPTPDAFWIHPEMHGLILKGLEYARPEATQLLALPSTYKDFYPQQVLADQRTAFAAVAINLDVKVMAKTAETLLGPKSPIQFATFLKGCLVANPPRPGQLLQEFDELIARLYGKREFHVFTMAKD